MDEPSSRSCPLCGQPRQLLSVSDAAYTAGVTRKTIYRWVDSGKLPHCVLPSGIIRIFPENLLKMRQLRRSKLKVRGGNGREPENGSPESAGKNYAPGLKPATD